MAHTQNHSHKHTSVNLINSQDIDRDNSTAILEHTDEAPMHINVHHQDYYQGDFEHTDEAPMHINVDRLDYYQGDFEQTKVKITAEYNRNCREDCGCPEDQPPSYDHAVAGYSYSHNIGAENAHILDNKNSANSNINSSVGTHGHRCDKTDAMAGEQSAENSDVMILKVNHTGTERVTDTNSIRSGPPPGHIIASPHVQALQSNNSVNNGGHLTGTHFPIDHVPGNSNIDDRAWLESSNQEQSQVGSDVSDMESDRFRIDLRGPHSELLTTSLNLISVRSTISTEENNNRLPGSTEHRSTSSHVEATPEPSATTAPPVQGSTTAPPSQGSTTAPPVQGSTTAPPSQGSTTAPPSQDSTTAPPGQGSTTATPSQGATTAPPVQDSTTAPPGQSSTTPGQNSTTPGQSSTTPGQSSTTPGQSSTTPGQGSTTPGQSSISAPPIQGSTTAPPSQGSTTAPPAQGSTILYYILISMTLALYVVWSSYQISSLQQIVSSQHRDLEDMTLASSGHVFPGYPFIRPQDEAPPCDSPSTVTDSSITWWNLIKVALLVVIARYLHVVPGIWTQVIQIHDDFHTMKKNLARNTQELEILKTKVRVLETPRNITVPRDDSGIDVSAMAIMDTLPDDGSDLVTTDETVTMLYDMTTSLDTLTARVDRMECQQDTIRNKQNSMQLNHEKATATNTYIRCALLAVFRRQTKDLIKYIENLGKDRDLQSHNDHQRLAQLEELSHLHLPSVLGILWGLLQQRSVDVAPVRTIWGVLVRLITPVIKGSQLELMRLGGVPLTLRTLQAVNGPSTETLMRHIMIVLHQILVAYPDMFRHVERKHVDRLLVLSSHNTRSTSTRWLSAEILTVMLYRHNTHPDDTAQRYSHTLPIPYDDVETTLRRAVVAWPITVENYPDIHPDKLDLYCDWLCGSGSAALRLCGAWAVWYLIRMSSVRTISRVMDNINHQRLEELRINQEIDTDTDRLIGHIITACRRHERPEETFDMIVSCGGGCDSAPVTPNSELTDSGFVSSL